jgi:hypothetical protein
MVILSAWWGLGCSALTVSAVTFGWYLLKREKAVGLSGLILTLISTVLLWIGLISRAARGYGWPFASSADSAAGIALLMLLTYSIWKLFTDDLETGFAVTAIALILFSYGFGQQHLPLFNQSRPSTGIIVGLLLKLCGGSLLALAAAISITPLMNKWLSSRSRSQSAYASHDPSGGFGPENIQDAPFQAARLHPERPDLQHASEVLVRGALLCLAFSLAIDTWWLQKVGLGNTHDAQQAGIALAWMVYFGALRLRAHPRWRGWPWAAILSIGFICVLPILIDAPWLEQTLPI